ncbi:hepatocyte cell adhesion molecule-like isoform X2 [Alosa sapidissima]|uniref:hepatocyte cell adhesion molecule-like isoform X2 n=1 Tax=Alosa sapidissima TaxID=34773 RepID=UPI001C08CB31|nr:hepatocyte cell adhesion molecule-like isoform X2 [Alosa sapidissima]
MDAACYGALGGPVYLQLMRDTTGHRLNVHYEGAPVVRLKGSTAVFYEEFNTPSFLQRWQFVPDNGTMIINPAESRDAGTYRVVTTNETSGRLVGQHTVQLTIEAPVSDVDLSISCSSANGERSVRCSSNGDSPQFSWSLDGRPLGEADLSSDNQTLLLRGDVTGQLTCSVRNHVSSTHTTRLMELCSANHNLPSVSVTPQRLVSVIFMSYFLVFILVCLCVAAWMFYVWRKRRNTHTPGQKASDTHTQHCEKAEAYELEYVEMSAYKCRPPADTHTPAETVVEVEAVENGVHTHTPAETVKVVEYGEVRVHTHTPPSTDTHTPAQQDNSVYDHVHPRQ